MPTSPLERLRALAFRTLADLDAAPRELAAIHLAAFEVVADALPEPRVEALIDTYADRSLRDAAGVADPAIRALLRLPLPADLAAALDRAGLAPAACALDLHQRSWLAGCLAPLGLSALQRATLVEALAAGEPAERVLGRLSPYLLHEALCGPPRSWDGGWPAWTLVEAAVTAVHAEVVPAHIFPTEPGGALPAYRQFALIGAHLRAWVGDDGVRALCQADHADAVWGPKVGAALRLADLQAWMARGGAYLGPAFTDPVAWVKLLDAAFGGGPLDDLLDRIKGPITPTLAASVPDLLTAAMAVPWSEFASWTRPGRPATDRRAAVAAMFVEDIRGQALVAVPSDPPGGELVLDVATASLSARPRAHHQYTEPARWIVDPAWCASLAARGLERVVLTGCTWESRDALVDTLAGLDDQVTGPERRLQVGPATPVPTPPSASQLRPPDGVLALGGAFATALGEALCLVGLTVTPGPYGETLDPISTARALAACSDDAPLSPDDLVGPGPWTGRWHDPRLRFPTRSAAATDLQRRLDDARAAATRQRLVLLAWQTAWGRAHPEASEITPSGPRLLGVEEIVDATAAAVHALRELVGPTQVVLAIDPAREPDPIADRLSKAVLSQAAARLVDARLVEPFYALEIVHDELRDHSFYAEDGLGRSDETMALLRRRLLGGWVAPVARDQRVLAPAASDAREPVVEVSAVEAPPRGDHTHLTALLSARATLSLEDEPAWVVSLEDELDTLPPLPEGASAHLDALRALADAIGDLGDPELLAGAFARLLRGLVPCGAWSVDAFAPLLRIGLARHWTDGLVPELSALPPDLRHALGEALLAGAAPPRRGQLARTPMHKALVALLGSP